MQDVRVKQTIHMLRIDVFLASDIILNKGNPESYDSIIIAASISLRMIFDMTLAA